jgi:hypothetical protein
MLCCFLVKMFPDPSHRRSHSNSMILALSDVSNFSDDAMLSYLRWVFFRALFRFWELQTPFKLGVCGLCNLKPCTGVKKHTIWLLRIGCLCDRYVVASPLTHVRFRTVDILLHSYLSTDLDDFLVSESSCRRVSCVVKRNTPFRNRRIFWHPLKL